MEQPNVSQKNIRTTKTAKKGGFATGFWGGVLGSLSVLFISAIVFLLFHQSTLFQSLSKTSTDSAVNNTVETVSTNVTNSQLTDTINAVKDSVVSIVNLRETSASFGFQTSEAGLTKASEGSGVIYKIEGDEAYVVTNNHVIDQAQELEVLLSDGTKVAATLVGADKWTDLAVLKISSSEIKSIAQFANSDQVLVGETALAIGSPLGSEYATSVTQGIISATNRSVDSDIDGDGEGDWVMTAIQTDAAINPGNSGGALINQAGQVIGINSMKISNASVEGMGFAIPSNEVVRIINELERNTYITRPVMGVNMYNIAGVANRARENYGISTDLTEGVIITKVISGSAAEAAGLQAYDVIVKMDDTTIGTIAEFRKQLYSYQVGETITVSFYRGNQLKQVKIHLTDATEQL